MDAKNMALTALVLFAIASTISQVEAIQCYTCNSLVDGSDCLDPFVTATTMMDCAQCQKTKYVNDGGINVVTRACLRTVGATAGCQSETVENQSADLCHCDTDLCNGSGGYILSLAVLIIPTIVQILRAIL